VVEHKKIGSPKIPLQGLNAFLGISSVMGKASTIAPLEADVGSALTGLLKRTYDIVTML